MIQTTINIETVAWMQLLDAANSDKKYYLVGHVRRIGNKEYDAAHTTLAVSEKGTGSTHFYCVKHKFVYSINHGACEECQKQVADTG